MFDFKTIQIKTETRGQECTCFIFRIARTKYNEKSPLEALSMSIFNALNTAANFSIL